MNEQLTAIYSSPRKINQDADQALADSLAGAFPIENKNYILSTTNVKAYPKSYTHVDEKEAILKSKSLTYPIRGDLTLTSKVTGKVVDHVKDFPLLDSFFVTDKHTLLYKGNNYSVSNQLQLLPGVYTRTRENTGELEAHFNTAKGASFRVVLDPRTKVFFVEVGSSHTPIGPLLSNVFHVTKSEAIKFIPEDVWDANVAYTAGKEEKSVRNLYSRMVYTKKPKPTLEEMEAELRESLSNSQLNEETTKVTLGKSFSGVTKDTLLYTLRNLVQVHKGDQPEDNRDSLQFNR